MKTVRLIESTTHKRVIQAVEGVIKGKRTTAKKLMNERIYSLWTLFKESNSPRLKDAALILLAVGVVPSYILGKEIKD